MFVCEYKTDGLTVLCSKLENMPDFNSHNLPVFAIIATEAVGFFSTGIGIPVSTIIAIIEGILACVRECKELMRQVAANQPGIGRLNS